MTNNAWDTASRLADKHANQGGPFIRLAADGDHVVGAFCGEPFAREVVWVAGYETYDPAVHTDKRPSLRVMREVIGDVGCEVLSVREAYPGELDEIEREFKRAIKTSRSRVTT